MNRRSWAVFTIVLINTQQMELQRSICIEVRGFIMGVGWNLNNAVVEGLFNKSRNVNFEECQLRD